MGEAWAYMGTHGVKDPPPPPPENLAFTLESFTVNPLPLRSHNI